MQQRTRPLFVLALRSRPPCWRLRLHRVCWRGFVDRIQRSRIGATGNRKLMLSLKGSHRLFSGSAEATTEVGLPASSVAYAQLAKILLQLLYFIACFTATQCAVG